MKFEEHNDKYINSVNYHPSGKYLASGGRDDKIIIYDLIQKKKISELSDNSLVT